MTFGEEVEEPKEEGDSTWMKTGDALGAGAKIYGYRVDNIHQNTYKVLGGLNRNGRDVMIVEEEAREEEEEEAGTKAKSKKKIKKMWHHSEKLGEGTLDK